MGECSASLSGRNQEAERAGEVSKDDPGMACEPDPAHVPANDMTRDQETPNPALPNIPTEV
jgi:hypothetical protein